MTESASSTEAGPRERRERRARWLEIAITISVSAIVSAVSVAWTMSAIVADMRASIGEHDRVLARHEMAIDATERVNADQAVQQGKTSTEVATMLRTLERMDQKLDAIYTRQNGVRR